MKSLLVVLVPLFITAFIIAIIVGYIRQRHVERTGLVVLGTVVGFKPRSKDRGEMLMEITLDYPLDDGTPWSGVVFSFRQPKKDRTLQSSLIAMTLASSTSPTSAQENEQVNIYRASPQGERRRIDS